MSISQLNAHGGLLKTTGVAQKMLSAAMGAPISVASGASEGGAWGMAILASYTASGSGNLSTYLESEVFANSETVTVNPNENDLGGFETFLKRYRRGLHGIGSASTDLA